MTPHSLNAGVDTLVFVGRVIGTHDNGDVVDTIMSGDLKLAAHFARPPGSVPVPGVVLCHGFPIGPRGAATSAATYFELVDRITRDTGWAALAFHFRGCGTSEGDFSVDGWLADIGAAVGALDDRHDVRGIWLVGVGEGGMFAVCAAADDARVRGVATLGAPITFGDSAREPGRLLQYARDAGMITTPDFPSDVAAWNRAVTQLDAVKAAHRLPPRPLLVLHGSDDQEVLVDEARALADAARPFSELCVVHAGGHRLRHDPRAIAALLGWLDRQAR